MLRHQWPHRGHMHVHATAGMEQKYPTLCSQHKILWSYPKRNFPLMLRRVLYIIESLLGTWPLYIGDSLKFANWQRRYMMSGLISNIMSSRSRTRSDDRHHPCVVLA